MHVWGADYVAYYFFVFWGGTGGGGVVDEDEAGLWGEVGELETPDVRGHAGGDGVGGEGWREGCAALGGFGVSGLFFFREIVWLGEGWVYG